MFFKDRSKKLQMVNEKEALPGRQDVMKFNENHFVNGSLMKGPFPEDSSELYPVSYTHLTLPTKRIV